MVRMSCNPARPQRIDFYIFLPNTLLSYKYNFFKVSGKLILHILMLLTSVVGIVTSLIQMYVASTFMATLWTVNILVDTVLGVFCLQHDIFSMQVSVRFFFSFNASLVCILNLFYRTIKTSTSSHSSSSTAYFGL